MQPKDRGLLKKEFAHLAKMNSSFGGKKGRGITSAGLCSSATVGDQYNETQGIVCLAVNPSDSPSIAVMLSLGSPTII
jgi:hypothetical protein